MKNFDEEYVVRTLRRDEEGKPIRDAQGDLEYEVVHVSRNERAKKERTFTIGGETFAYKPAVAPESVLEWSQMIGGELPELTEEDSIGIYDRTIQAFLEPGQLEKWTKVRKPEAGNPLTVGDMSALVRWLFEEQVGRPTLPPSDSTAGSRSGGTTTTSTVASDSPAGPA